MFRHHFVLVGFAHASISSPCFVYIALLPCMTLTLTLAFNLAHCTRTLVPLLNCSLYYLVHSTSYFLNQCFCPCILCVFKNIEAQLGTSLILSIPTHAPTASSTASSLIPVFYRASAATHSHWSRRLT
ncbi:hypothetical protein BDR03DRAFT_373737 [Suillus americanus]|nr:hypothetical protein BDR03DRAFT_373737 [Suillus americanus]